MNLKKFKSRLSSKFQAWFHASANGSKMQYLQETVRLQRVSNDYLMSLLLAGQSIHPNPLLQFGKKYFSQADEDGIIEDILFRIRKKPLTIPGFFVEMGVGNGLQPGFGNGRLGGGLTLFQTDLALAIGPVLDFLDRDGDFSERFLLVGDQ